jgi:hypothetical protein
MNALIGRVLSEQCFSAAPPVFLDIGASGALPASWTPVAPYSVCVAFDADTRDFELREAEQSGWHRLYTLNRLVAPEASPAVAFHLTRSPHCSSALPPDLAALRPWAFQPLFEVTETVKLAAVELGAVLRELKLERVDWFKCDSQGTDLRIFKSLDARITDRTLVADFEPGIIDAYQGEDKLHDVLAYMEDRPFWISDMIVKGSQRIDPATLATFGPLQRRSPGSFLRSAPGWCEISYMNECDSPDLGIRDCLLAWVFASLKGHHGFALGLATSGRERFGDRLFDELRACSCAKLGRGYGRLAMDLCRRVLSRRGH